MVLDSGDQRRLLDTETPLWRTKQHNFYRPYFHLNLNVGRLDLFKKSVVRVKKKKCFSKKKKKKKKSLSLLDRCSKNN